MVMSFHAAHLSGYIYSLRGGCRGLWYQGSAIMAPRIHFRTSTAEKGHPMNETTDALHTGGWWNGWW